MGTFPYPMLQAVWVRAKGTILAGNFAGMDLLVSRVESPVLDGSDDPSVFPSRWYGKLACRNIDPPKACKVLSLTDKETNLSFPCLPKAESQILNGTVKQVQG